jgi:hypothetical protein
VSLFGAGGDRNETGQLILFLSRAIDSLRGGNSRFKSGHALPVKFPGEDKKYGGENRRNNEDQASEKMVKTGERIDVINQEGHKGSQQQDSAPEFPPPPGNQTNQRRQKKYAKANNGNPGQKELPVIVKEGIGFQQTDNGEEEAEYT